MSDPAACPGRSPSCATPDKLSCSFRGCGGLASAQDKVRYTPVSSRYITGATVEASCSNGGESFSVLETFNSTSLVMAVAAPEYLPLQPGDSDWCLHPDCLPAAGLAWRGHSDLAGPDCVEEEGRSAWCVGDLAKILWTGETFTLSQDACKSPTSSVCIIIMTIRL